MAKNKKSEPAEQPEGYGPLSKTLEKALGDAGAKSKLSVELRVSGGMPAQAYYLHFRASDAGDVECEMRCALSGRESKMSKERTLAQKDWTMLLQTIHTSRVLDLPQEAPRFLPDTVVGDLEISDGESKHRLYFAADEEQAKVQKRIPPPELAKVVDVIYQLSSQLLDMPSVRP